MTNPSTEDEAMSELLDLTEPQRRAVMMLSASPQRARRGGPWSPIAAFNLVAPGYVKLHQSYLGDDYSLTRKGLALQGVLRARASQTKKASQL